MIVVEGLSTSVLLERNFNATKSRLLYKVVFDAACLIIGGVGLRDTVNAPNVYSLKEAVKPAIPKIVEI